MLNVVDDDSGTGIVNNDEIPKMKMKWIKMKLLKKILQHNAPGEIAWGKYREGVIAYIIKNTKNGSLWR